MIDWENQDLFLSLSLSQSLHFPFTKHNSSVSVILSWPLSLFSLSLLLSLFLATKALGLLPLLISTFLGRGKRKDSLFFSNTLLSTDQIKSDVSSAFVHPTGKK